MTEAPEHVHDLLWRRMDSVGIEHCRVTFGAGGLHADGLALGVEDNGLPYRLHYTILTDEAGVVTHVLLSDLLRPERAIVLGSDGAGHWRDKTSAPLHALDGCLDVDIAASAFTNTLPIRRLMLEPGRSAELDLVYLALPALEPARVAQRYTCLERTADSVRYQYQQGDFTAEIQVDSDGLVVGYSGLFQRAFAT